MKVKAMLMIFNAPEILHRYTVVRRSDDGTLWYYGTYEEKHRAKMAAKEINNGILVEVIE